MPDDHAPILLRLADQLAEMLVTCALTPRETRLVLIEVLLRLVQAEILLPEDLRDLPLRVLQEYLLKSIQPP